MTSPKSPKKKMFDFAEENKGMNVEAAGPKPSDYLQHSRLSVSFQNQNPKPVQTLGDVEEVLEEHHVSDGHLHLTYECSCDGRKKDFVCHGRDNATFELRDGKYMWTFTGFPLSSLNDLIKTNEFYIKCLSQSHYKTRPFSGEFMLHVKTSNFLRVIFFSLKNKLFYFQYKNMFARLAANLVSYGSAKLFANVAEGDYKKMQD